MRRLILIVSLAATGIVLLFFVPGGSDLAQLFLRSLGYGLLLVAVLVAGHKIADMNKAKSEPRDLP
jgi:L-cystine uptake protein TcyP (sodium:dicarboxylate symporter family)